MSRATPAPTPVATAQLNASVQLAARSAGIGGGVLLRATFQAFARTRCVMSPDKAPDPSEITFQLYVLRAAMVGLIPRLTRS